MERIRDWVRPEGKPYLDPILWRWSVATLFISSGLIGLGSVATGLGAPALGGTLIFFGAIHLGLLPDDGPVQYDMEPSS